MHSTPYKLPGPALLLAGPGTGKTYQLACRIKYLIEEQNITPDKIAVITFTTHAAASMRAKISDPNNAEFISPKKQPSLICTMHSLGYRILREGHSDLEMPENITVAQPDTLRDILIEDAAQLAGFKRSDGRETAEHRQTGHADFKDDKNRTISERYRQILRACCAIDHDDQILLAVEVLRRNPGLLEKYRASCNHLLIDEYQDINRAQFELICLLSEGQRKGLFVVGDEDQSIYLWRGGSPDYIRNFKKDFGPNALVEGLLESHRCPKHIYEGALAVVQKFDKGYISKGSMTFKCEDETKIQIHNVPSDEKEAEIIASIAKRGVPGAPVLVLLPDRGFTKAIIEKLRSRKIRFTAPLALPGNVIPLISTISSWLKDTSDNLRFRECLDSLIDNPMFGIPSKLSRTSEKLQAREDGLLKISALWNPVINGNTDSLWVALQSKVPRDELYSKIHSTLNNIKELKDHVDDPANLIAEIIRTFLPRKKTAQLLDEMESWTQYAIQTGDLIEAPPVKLIILQGAKGLQAKIVCVVGLQEGIMPRPDSTQDKIAEQARLMYVSMTRAQNELHLFQARKRSSNVMRKVIYKKGFPPDLKPSPFLSVIPAEHVDKPFHPA